MHSTPPRTNPPPPITAWWPVLSLGFLALVLAAIGRSDPPLSSPLPPAGDVDTAVFAVG